MRRCLFLLLLPLFLLPACGEGSEPEDAGDLLDRAFSTSIDSADVTFDAQLDVRGVKSFEEPLRIQASGPFRSAHGTLPQADLTVQLGSDDDGQAIETGFLSTGDRAFVKFQDVYYEQPRAEVARTNRELRKRAGRRRSSLTALGLDPRTWLATATDEGEERVDGVQTHHVAGTLDVAAVLADLNGFVRRSSRALAGEAPPTLTRTEIAQVAQLVQDPSFDVYVGVDDDVIRRISGRIELDVPEAQQASINGIEGGTLEFSIEFHDVNGDQEIEAPRRARPLSELMRAIGGAGALGDALGAAGDSVDDGSDETGTDTTPETIPTTPTTPLEPTPSLPDRSTPQTSTEPDAEDFRNYAECLDKARPEDTEALQLCAELLQG